jgi:hypothetical protein
VRYFTSVLSRIDEHSDEIIYVHFNLVAEAPPETRAFGIAQTSLCHSHASSQSKWRVSFEPADMAVGVQRHRPYGAALI